MPADLKKYIKKTTKVCVDYPKNKTIDFYVFALSGYEMGAGSFDYDNDEWPYTGIKYPFFTSNSSRIVGDGVKWSTREPDGFLSGTEPYSCLIINEGGVLQGEPQTSHDPIYAVGAFAFE